MDQVSAGFLDFNFMPQLAVSGGVLNGVANGVGTNIANGVANAFSSGIANGIANGGGERAVAPAR